MHKFIDSKIFVDEISTYFTISENLIGAGNLESIDPLLYYNTFNDGDIFVLGGAIYDYVSSFDKSKLTTQTVINKILFRYPNSKIIFWSAPVRTTHRFYEMVEKSKAIRDMFVNNTNIFHCNFKVDDSNFVDDNHFNKENEYRQVIELKDFIIERVPLLIKNRVDTLILSNNISIPFKNEYVDLLVRVPLDNNIRCNSIYKVFNDTNLRNLVTQGYKRERPFLIKIPNLEYINLDPLITPIHGRVVYYT